MNGDERTTDELIAHLAGVAGEVAGRLHDGAELSDALGALDGLARATDLVASATVAATSRADVSGAAVERTGLPTDRWLSLYARRAGSDVGMLLACANLLRRLPATRRRFADGELSWGEVRAIVREAGRLTGDELAELDDAIADAALDEMSAERFIGEVAYLVDRLRPDLAEADQKAAYRRRYLAWQPALDGSLAFHGEVDPTGAAELCEALGVAERTTDRDPGGYDTERPWIGTGRRRLDALLDICSEYLAGTDGGDGADGRRARPRLHAIVDLSDLDRLDGTVWGQLVARHLSGPVYLSPDTLDRLADDADLRLHFRDAERRTLGVSRPSRFVSPHLDEALLVADGGCRMPGCTVAHQRCDADHTIPRRRGGRTVLPVLADKCRTHHPLCEDGGPWSHTLGADRTMAFVDPDGRRFTTHPHTRRLLEPDTGSGTDPPDRRGTTTDGPVRTGHRRPGGGPPGRGSDDGPLPF